MTTCVVIPFRDRGRDPLRRANLDRVLSYWHDQPYPWAVVSDGRGLHFDEQFNRSAAYNRGVELMIKHDPDVDVFVFAESDMLISTGQVTAAIRLAREAPGLVVPFDSYHYLSRKDSEKVRKHQVQPERCKPEWRMAYGKAIGAINVVSRQTLELIGQWDETFEGSWYDDDAHKIAFDMCTFPTRWVPGPAHHLYHLPGHTGSHLTEQDKQATTFNRLRLRKYQSADSPGRIRELTKGGG